jgi:hypothetical protein
LCKQGLTFKPRLFASLYFGPGLTESVGLLVVNLYFYFFIGLQFRAGQTAMPACTKPCSLCASKCPDVSSFSSLSLSS